MHHAPRLVPISSISVLHLGADLPEKQLTREGRAGARRASLRCSGRGVRCEGWRERACRPHRSRRARQPTARVHFDHPPGGSEALAGAGRRSQAQGARFLSLDFSRGLVPFLLLQYFLMFVAPACARGGGVQCQIYAACARSAAGPAPGRGGDSCTRLSESRACPRGCAAGGDTCDESHRMCARGESRGHFKRCSLREKITLSAKKYGRALTRTARTHSGRHGATRARRQGARRSSLVLLVHNAGASRLT